ncbi:MAG: HAD family hydrolase [Treponema sp.]|nr:HAD family hydrolase [Treponema sp.]
MELKKITKSAIFFNMFDSLIFDVDGTIWDTTPVVAPAWNEALDEMGLSYAHVTADDLKGLFGKPMDVIIKAILPEESDEVRRKYEELCYEKEEAAVGSIGGKLYPDMKETFEVLSKKYKMYIVSNCQSGYIETMLRVTGFGPYFMDHACFGDAKILKAGNIRLIIERNGLNNPAYIGDTQGDADATHEAGIPFIHASYGFGKTVDKAEYTIKGIKDLLDL